MIQRVYAQASKAKSLDRVIVATDDERIQQHVQAFGGEVMMTSSDHLNGTERCGEVLQNLDESYDLVFNIQGDEPFIKPAQIDQLASVFDRDEVQIATLAKEIKFKKELIDPSIIKILFDNHGQALYFSRAAVPFVRDLPESDWIGNHTFYKHICFYGFRTSILQEVIKLKPTPLELAESLEQLRWMESGYKIHIGVTELDSQSIDTPEDLEKLVSK
jgi:3-deoxy-manno-octulosonate cytidylyltransferase (CMP-KDO synthetase)